MANTNTPTQNNAYKDNRDTSTQNIIAREVEAPSSYAYARFLPDFSDKTISESFPPLIPFNHSDPGLRALSQPEPRSFLANTTKVKDLTPHIGTEIDGSDLTTIDKDQLALEVARRKVVVFRNQKEFLSGSVDDFRAWGKHFGRLHVHPTSAHPADAPELHLVYRDAHTSFNFELGNRVTSTVWHSDVSYELQPPGLTTLMLLASPPTGGDTLYISQVAALKKLSVPFVEFLKTLKAVHSGVEQANHSLTGKRGGIVRRQPVQHVHPVVRRHPTTGEEALYVNKEFTRHIIGLKHEESETILNFLYDHMAKAADAQVRISWEPESVVIWDNRVTAHTAIVDFEEFGSLRHGVRITPQAERPIPAGDVGEL